MGIKNDGIGAGESSRDAVDWFVDNTSELEPEAATLLQWAQWCSDPQNCTEYRGIVELQLQLLQLSAPSQPSREALIADAL